MKQQIDKRDADMITFRLTPTVIVPVTTADHTNIYFILNVMIKTEVTALTHCCKVLSLVNVSS